MMPAADATMPGADLRPLLDAALAELDGAIDALGTAAAQPAAAGKEERAAGSVHAERAPAARGVPGGSDAAVRARERRQPCASPNPAASALAGRPAAIRPGSRFSALVEPSCRPAVRSLLAAAARTAGGRQLDCQLLTGQGRIHCVLDVRPGQRARRGRLAAGRGPRGPARGRAGSATDDGAPHPIAEQVPPDPVVTVMTRRLDLATDSQPAAAGETHVQRVRHLAALRPASL